MATHFARNATDNPVHNHQSLLFNTTSPLHPPILEKRALFFAISLLLMFFAPFTHHQATAARSTRTFIPQSCTYSPSQKLRFRFQRTPLPEILRTLSNAYCLRIQLPKRTLQRRYSFRTTRAMRGIPALRQLSHQLPNCHLGSCLRARPAYRRSKRSNRSPYKRAKAKRIRRRRVAHIRRNKVIPPTQRTQHNRRTKTHRRSNNTRSSLFHNLKKQIKRYAHNRFGVPCNVARSMAAAPEQLANQGYVYTHPSGRFQLYGIHKHSIFRMLGLRNKDILLSVNGYVVNSVARAMIAYWQMRNTNRFTLKIQRGKKRKNLYYRLLRCP
ncbi:MAG: hypothetical protein AAGJ35_02335 [Myxococcota bacterium]